ncbi:MAG: META domain-containing protein [Parvularculaceae bacterium]
MTIFLSLAALAAMTTASACAASGGASAARLIGAEWAVEDINGGGVIDNSRATLGFGEDGRIAGRASCNTYSAPYSLTRAGLTIGPAAVTRKACAPALMDQEQKFLAALAGASAFSIDDTGALILTTPDGKRILARR